MSKVLQPVLTLNFLILGLASRLRQAIASKIPLGYQDASGFHYGVKQYA